MYTISIRHRLKLRWILQKIIISVWNFSRKNMLLKYDIAGCQTLRVTLMGKIVNTVESRVKSNWNKLKFYNIKFWYCKWNILWPVSNLRRRNNLLKTGPLITVLNLFLREPLFEIHIHLTCTYNITFSREIYQKEK